MSLVEEAGFAIGPYLGTAPGRDQRRAQCAANRRFVAVQEKDLYEKLARMIPFLPSYNRYEQHLLNVRQDQAFLIYLRSASAFLGFRLNEDFRRQRIGSGTGRILTDAEVWEILRENGFWWKLNEEGRGRWTSLNGPLYSDEEEALTGTFRRLLVEGAFTTRGISREFAGHDESYIFRQTLEMGISWSYARGVWTLGSGPPLFGDEIQTLQRR